LKYYNLEIIIIITEEMVAEVEETIGVEEVEETVVKRNMVAVVVEIIEEMEEEAEMAVEVINIKINIMVKIINNIIRTEINLKNKKYYKKEIHKMLIIKKDLPFKIKDHL